MIKKLKISLLIIILFLLQSCLDMFADEPKFIVGKICVWSSAGSKEKCLMIETGKNTFSYIFNEIVFDVKANDSIMCVKNHYEDEYRYYLLRHDKGNKVLNIDTIDSLKFYRIVHLNKFTYSYNFGE